MPKKNDYKKMTVTLHPIQYQEVMDVATEKNATYSEIVRAALNMYLTEHGETK